MKITAIEIESHDGRTIRIQAGLELGTVHVIVGTQAVISFTDDDVSYESEQTIQAGWEKVVELGKLAYGSDRRGRPAATNSMLHDLRELVDRVACV